MLVWNISMLVYIHNVYTDTLIVKKYILIRANIILRVLNEFFLYSEKKGKKWVRNYF